MKDKLDEMLEELSTTKSKEVVEKEKFELDVSDKEELAKELIKLTREDRKMADRLFELFYPEISSGHDRSQASKEALSRALELKINAGRNIIDLIKIMKQEEKLNNSIGFFFSGKKNGIDIKNIQDSYVEEENELEDFDE